MFAIVGTWLMDLCIHPLCRLKNPTVIKIWLLVGFRPATRSVQSTPAERQAVYRERKKEREHLQNAASHQGLRYLS